MILTMSVTLQEISKSFGSRILFDGVTATFNQGNRYGLTGPNGAGKSTLLKIINGEETPSSGTVALPDRVGMLRQNIEDYRDYDVIDVVIMGNQRLWDAMTERDQLYEQEMTDEVGMRLGDLEGIVVEENGYSAESDAEMLLAGMGIPEEHHHLKMKEIPTDIQFRVLLCQALFGEPQALFLDEPTNHLDMDSIRWLEEFLHNYTGVIIVISHDRHFLNAITTDIADIDYDTIIVYPGNYDEMVFQKTSVRDQAVREGKSREKKVAQLKEFIARFGAGTRASQVQSRKREMEKLQPQELKKSNIERPYIRFIPTEKAPGKIVLKADSISKSYDGNNVIKNFSFELEKGDKVGVIGANGLGKTTLIKMLTGYLEPDSGKVELGHQAQIAYFPQNHHDVIDKSTNLNAFDWIKSRREGVYDQEVRSVMGKMLFGGDDAFKAVKTLSGGETARVILAEMMLLEHNTLIFDEPNNHLDLEAVSALAWGLNEYKGTVLVVSHDRDLIETVAKKLIIFTEDGIEVFQGPYAEYIEQKAKT
ncbi:MAG: putative ABC transporter ATP-binding protein YbiT [Chlamydiae bacterium]|nr:putative ABC transporter ATP-binding protein YbiT [Chlamydiota bacterium]